MAVISETYRQYEIWCRPLKRAKYSFAEMRTKAISPDSEGSTALLRKMREAERKAIEASGILQKERQVPQRDAAFDEYTSSLSTTSESYAAFQERDNRELPLSSPVASATLGDQEESSAEIPMYQPRLRRIRDRIQEAVFDFSEIEQERIEEEVNNLVNADGYYNEIDPIDIDTEYEKEKSMAKPAIIAVAVFIIYVIIILKF